MLHRSDPRTGHDERERREARRREHDEIRAEQERDARLLADPTLPQRDPMLYEVLREQQRLGAEVEIARRLTGNPFARLPRRLVDARRHLPDRRPGRARARGAGRPAGRPAARTATRSGDDDDGGSEPPPALAGPPQHVARFARQHGLTLRWCARCQTAAFAATDAERRDLALAGWTPTCCPSCSGVAVSR